MNAITIETINFDTVIGFLTTFKELPKKAENIGYVVENDTLQTYAIYKVFKTNKTYLIKTL